MSISEPTGHAMSAAQDGNPVTAAAHRLDDALGRLEALVEKRAAREGELQSALREARDENAQLRELLQTLAGRVDAAVSRLEEVLEE